MGFFSLRVPRTCVLQNAPGAQRAIVSDDDLFSVYEVCKDLNLWLRMLDKTVAQDDIFREPTTRLGRLDGKALTSDTGGQWNSAASPRDVSQR